MKNNTFLNNHKLQDIQVRTINALKRYKEKSKQDKEENYFVLTANIQSFIYALDVSPTSKLLLLYLLSKVDYSLRHLYIHAPYSLIKKEAYIQRATALKCLKQLHEKGYIEYPTLVQKCFVPATFLHHLELIPKRTSKRIAPYLTLH